MYSGKKFKGKNKTEVTREAFQKLGVNATNAAVSAYAKKEYGITKPIETSMYYTEKATARLNREKQQMPVRNAVDAARRNMPSLKSIVVDVVKQHPEGINLFKIVEAVRAMVQRGEYATNAQSLPAVVSQAMNAAKQEALITYDRESSLYNVPQVKVQPPSVDVFAVIRQVQTLANTVGGVVKLRELVELVEKNSLNQLLNFVGK